MAIETNNIPRLHDIIVIYLKRGRTIRYILQKVRDAVRNAVGYIMSSFVGGSTASLLQSYLILFRGDFLTFGGSLLLNSFE